MILNKIIGYILLAVGLAIIIFTVFQSYNFYTNKALAPEIFKAPETENVLQKTPGYLDIQAQVQNVVEQQIGQVLPSDVLYRIFNLAAWSFFAFILIFAGGTLAGIGVKLIKIV